jgi:hypothetical protein
MLGMRTMKPRVTLLTGKADIGSLLAYICEYSHSRAPSDPARPLQKSIGKVTRVLRQLPKDDFFQWE